jgi:ribosome-associated toxin RatA of RatAB toxin-antitoxin module
MPKVSASAVVQAAPEEVFSFIADYRNIPRLQPEFATARVVSEQQMGAGAIVELQGRFHGVPMRAQNRIVTFTPPRRLVSISEGAVLSRNTWELQPHAGELSGTLVTFVVEYKVAGPLGGIFTGVASSLFHKEIQAMTDGSLRRLQEIFSEEGTKAEGTDSQPSS